MGKHEFIGGPWHLLHVSSNMSTKRILDTDHLRIATFQHVEPGNDQDKRMRLMFAAPDLLEALEAFESTFSSAMVALREGPRMADVEAIVPVLENILQLHNARAAIAKALGEEATG